MQLFFAVTAMLVMSGCEKGRLDDQVRRLCAIDGGVRVYQTVKLPPDRFDTFGVVSIPSKEKAKPADEYFYEWDVEYLQKGNPSLLRSHHRVIRRKDGKVLGELVRYARGGGDLPSPLHDSSFMCPPRICGPAQLGGVDISGSRRFALRRARAIAYVQGRICHVAKR
jgi:hypothetical protein